MKKISIITFILYLVFYALTGCEKTKIDPENIFTKIYDDPNSDISYYPVDIAQLADGSYIILGASSLDTTHTWVNPVIIGTSDQGELEWITNIEIPYVNPISNLMEINGSYYFFCMDEITLGAYLMMIDIDNHSASMISSFTNLTYPLAVSKTPNNSFLLLSYERLLRQSVITKINSSSDIIWQKKCNVMEDVEPFLIDHLIKTGKSIPFFTGSLDGASPSHYFANCLNNYTLSMLFFNASSGEITGIAQGFRYDGGAVSAVAFPGNTFALSHFNFGEHYLLPSVNIDLNSITTIRELGGSKLAEISAESETRIKRITIEGKPGFVVAASTNNNQVVLYFYDLASLELVGKKFLGFSNPVKIGSVIQTSDEGIAVLAQTMVAGRFKRISFFKIPKEHLR